LDNEEQFGRPRLKRKPLTANAEEKPASANPETKPEPKPQAIPDIPVPRPEPPVPAPQVNATSDKPAETQSKPPRPDFKSRPPRDRDRDRDRGRDDRRPPRSRDQHRPDFRARSSDRPERQDRPNRPDRPERTERIERPARPLRTDPVKLSVVIPAYNEEGNIAPLLEQFKVLFASVAYRCELIIVDDGSTDKTGARIKEALPQYPWLKLFTHRRNFGLTTALETGIGKASGKIICFYPADLQYHANEIPKFVAKIDSGADVVTGWKQGNYGLKSIGSFIYNLLSRMLFKVKVHDLNSIKAFTREVVDSFIYRRGWHRYMVVMATGEGFKVDEVKVKLFPRRSGKSKFSFWWRLPSGFLDLLSVKFQLSFTTKPLLFFGSAGMISGLLGFLVGLVAIYLRVIKHSGFRPLLYLVILLIMSGLMLFFGGFLAELIVSVKDDVKKRKSTNLL
jgi:glycosyltransferase involved in cell wall biosynthesis